MVAIVPLLVSSCGYKGHLFLSDKDGESGYGPISTGIGVKPPTGKSLEIKREMEDSKKTKESTHQKAENGKDGD